MKYVYVFDFGGTRVKYGLFFKNEIIAKGSFATPTDKPLKEILAKVKKLIIRENGKNNINISDILGIGIALPGLVDFEKQNLKTINGKYMDAVNFNINGWFKEEMDLSVVIENDAHAALLGEKTLGTINGATEVLLMTFGTGVGTSVMLNGKIIRGKNQQAGNLGGHITVKFDGRLCSCGNRGCLEAEASTWALKKMLSELKKAKSEVNGIEPNFKSVIKHAKEGNLFAKSIITDYTNKWGAGLVNMIHAYDPEVIVLSGGIMNAKDDIVKPIKKYVKKHAWISGELPEFIISENPDYSVLHGLKYLVDNKGDKNV